MKGTVRQIKKHRLTQKIIDLLSLCDNNIRIVGFTTTVSVSIIKSKTKILSIEHTGNMGNSIKTSVDPNLKHIGLPTISELKDIYEVIEERGSPDYYYSIEFDIHVYKP